MAVEKYSLASSVIGEKRRLIAVGSGFDTKQSRSSESIKLISWGLRNTSTYEISEKNKPNFEFKTWLGKKEKIKGKTNEDVFITLNKKDIRNFKVFIKYEGPLKAPIKENEEIGEIIIKTNDAEDIIVPVYASETVEKVNFFKSLFMSFNYMIWGDV